MSSGILMTSDESGNVGQRYQVAEKDTQQNKRADLAVLEYGKVS
jgi:hypothetical protein